MILDLETLRKFVNVTVQVCNLQNEEVHGLMEMVALFEHCNRNHLCMSNLLEHIKAEEAKLPPSVDFNWPGARVLRFSSSRDAFYSPDEIFLDEETCEHVLLETIRFLREAQGLRTYDPRTPKEKFFKPQPQLMKELREKCGNAPLMHVGVPESSAIFNARYGLPRQPPPSSIAARRHTPQVPLKGSACPDQLRVACSSAR